ncbi:MAG TPA: hypothetical protein VKR54_04900 [Candidatus Babeliales bacterium]|jgi:hypothetical protein|nr:hypothetical protein [Candidatus Babeliales bacterium]
MKSYRHYALSIIASILPIAPCAAEDFNITLKPKWCNLDENCNKAAEFGGKWILVGSITFKKRCKDPICMDTINLHWNGETIDNLIASLYKKNLDKELFLPIEENLICDGLWNKAKQTLVLNFDEKENLGPTTIFYLVLTVPESIESILKKGSFCIEEQCLPKPFKQCAQHEKLSLAINEATQKCPPIDKIN